MSNNLCYTNLLINNILKKGSSMKLGSELLIKMTLDQLGRDKLKNRHKCCRW
jgi:hypothetical protein